MTAQLVGLIRVPQPNHGEFTSSSEPWLIAEGIFDINSQVVAKPMPSQFCDLFV